MLVSIRKSYLSQQVRILSYTFSFHLLMTGWCNTTVDFIDNEIVGPNPGIDDLTSVPFPCYNVRVSNVHKLIPLAKVVVLRNRRNRRNRLSPTRNVYVITLSGESYYIIRQEEFITLSVENYYIIG